MKVTTSYKITSMDIRDYLAMGVFTTAFILGSSYLYIHSSDANFATWAGLTATMGSVYHWLCIKDDKEPDA